MKVALVSDINLGSPSKYGVSELAKTLRCHGFNIEQRKIFPTKEKDKVILVSGADGDVLEKISFERELRVPPNNESYAVAKTEHPNRNIIYIMGKDDNGVKYGCFDLIEQIEGIADPENIFSELITRSASPDLCVRGLYTFLHNTDLEKEWFYSKEFWDGYFAMLARNRYNEFILVFGHQTAHFVPLYPYFFRVEQYPDVYVDGIRESDQEENLRALQYISNLAEKRGIKFFIGIWQSKPWSSEYFLGEQQSKVHGISDHILADYTRQGISKLLKVCPGIKGIQLRMNSESGITDQSFFTNVFVPAVEECGREIEVDIRNWELEPHTLEKFRHAFPHLRVSMKYFAEHQAMPYQPVEMRHSYSYDSLVRNHRTYELLWQVWNLGTHRLFLWGDPDYVRQFVASCHLGNALGFQITPPLSQKGFSQYGQVPGYWSIYRDKVEHNYYKWEYERYWFFYQLWGRLGYDPNLSDDFWLKEISKRFDKKSAPHLFNAYRYGSKVISYLISHHMDDPNMYIWLELDHAGLIDYFSGITPGEKTLFMNAEEYAEKRVKSIPSAKISPFQASKHLENFAHGCEQELEKTDQIGAVKKNQEYLFTKVDLEALSLLARYNSQKIRASTYLTLFYRTSDYSLLNKATHYAENALRTWGKLVALTDRYFYDRLQLGPTGGHWRDSLPYVEYDLNRIKKVEQLFKEYGIFEKGFDFGATPLEAKNEWEKRSDSVEKRFDGVFPTTKYSKERGYGWQKKGKLSAREAPFVNIYGLRGLNHFELNRKISDLPTEMLSPDFIGSNDEACFVIDLPNGAYRLTFLVGDNCESPSKHGPMSIFMNGEATITNFIIPKGRVDAIERKVEIRNKQLRIDFQPAKESDWIISGLILTRIAPRIGHLFADNALKGKNLAIQVTITSVAPVQAVQLVYKIKKDSCYRTTIMSRKKDLIWSAKIPGAELKCDEIQYFIKVEDVEGNVSSLPEEGKKNPFYTKLIGEYTDPRIIEHERILSHQSHKPLSLQVKVNNNPSVLDIKMHYRKVDQNEEFKTVSMKKDGEREYVGIIPVRELDSLYDMMYYFEVLDRSGNGTFYPDPFSQGRYFIVKMLS